MITKINKTVKWMKSVSLLSLFTFHFSLLTSFAQEKTVTGCVTDAATGKPLTGVIVAAYGNQKFSAMTDDQGRYELKVPDYTRSVVMQVEGYNLQQCAIAADNTANAKLFDEAFRETYAKTTTAILKGEATHFENNSEFSIDPLMARQLGADMRQVAHGGIAGMGSLKLIAGINSLNANAQPLVIIDDVVMDMQYNRELLHDGYFNNLLANLNVNDIESIQVLKNGTALYGAKGANGVLVIKTKRNKSMATKIDVTINGRYELVPRLPRMMDAESYRLYTTELLAGHTNPMQMGKMKYLSNDPNYYYYNQYHNETDWTDEVYQNAFSQNYGINVQGGDDAASYNLSVGYSLGNSTLRNNDFSRFDMRLNSDIKVLKGLDVRFDASYSDVDRSLRDDGAPQEPLEGVITSPGFLALAKAPFLSPYAFDKNGNVSHYLAEADDYLEGKFQGKGRLANPLSILEHGEGKNRNSMGNRLITFTITPKYEFNRHLSVQEHFTLALVNTNENYYLPIQGVPTFTVEGLDEGTTLQNIAQSMAARETAIQSDTRLNWNNRYDAHRIDVKAGLRYMSSDYKLTSQEGYNSGNDKTPNMSSSLRFKNTDGVDDKTRELLWYALGSYNYAERLYLDAGVSAHASSRFGDDADGLRLAGTVWGIFPSIEAAWVITNEPWFQQIVNCQLSIVNYLRLNFGFDITGNDDIDYTASRSYFIAKRMLGETVSGKVIGNIGNTELQWEKTSRLTAGLQAQLLGNRLSVGLNVFKSWTSNLLSLRQLAWTSGLEQNWTGEGKLENHGFDANIGVKVLALKDFSWEVGASAGHYKNELTALPDNNRAVETDIYGATVLSQVGQPVGVFYGYKYNGVYATTGEAQADGHYVLKQNGSRAYFEAGDARFADLDGNQLIDERDRTIIGDPNPDLYGNIFTTLKWKNLQLQAVMNYSLGNDIYNYQRSLLEGGNLFINQTTAIANRWTTEGQQTDIPRAIYNAPQDNSRFSDRWIEDGSYLRLSSVTLSWHLPIMSTYLQGITLFANATNLFTLTHYLGSDPDCAMAGGILSQGIDRGLLPAGRTFSVGININL